MIIQSFECVVDWVDEECAGCTLHDLTDHSKPVELAEVWLYAFGQNVSEGFVFTWNIHEEGSLQWNEFVFPVAKVWTEEEIKTIQDKASEIARALGWEK